MRIPLVVALAVSLTACGDGGASGPGGEPTDLTATAVSSFRVRLEWTDNATGETGFLIERGGGLSGAFAVIDTVPADTTTVLLRDQLPDSLLRYRVRALYPTDHSGPSNADTARTPPAPLLSEAVAGMVSAMLATISGTEEQQQYLYAGHTMYVKGIVFCEPADKDAEPGTPSGGNTAYGCPNASQSVVTSRTSEVSLQTIIQVAPFVDFSMSDSAGPFAGYSWGGTGTMTLDFDLVRTLEFAPDTFYRITGLAAVTPSTTAVITLSRPTDGGYDPIVANIEDHFAIYLGAVVAPKLALRLEELDPVRIP